MNDSLKKSVVSLLAAACLLTGCSKAGPEEVPTPSGSVDTSGAYHPGVPEVADELAAAQEKNADVVGWLQMPNTSINEAVVQTTDNEYYLRRDVEKKYSFEGCYYIDYESVMQENGTKLSQNTIVYGHNLGSPLGVKDDPNSAKFAQLFKLNDQTTAENTPYVYLVTPGKTHIFELFAAFYCEERLSPVPYHYAEYTGEKLVMLAKDAKARSTFTYDVEIAAEDQLLTLSTCTYKYGTYTQNPHQRFVVMGRLVQEGESYHEKAQLKPNPNPKEPQFS